MNASTPTVSQEHRRRKVRAEASAWVVQLHGPERSAALEAAFRDWLSVDPEHRREFECVTQVWDEARGIPISGITRLTQWNQPRTASRWATAAVSLLACVIGAFGVYEMWFAGVYKTGVGEQRMVRLEDGTRVSLNSDTKVEVRFANKERHVTLVRGEAYFEVAHNRQRPFIVTAGNHDVTAVGTAFVVRYDDGNTAITLVEGKVTVSHAVVAAKAAAKDETGATTDPTGERRVWPSTHHSHSSTDSAAHFSPTGSGAVAQIAPDVTHTRAEGEGLAQVVTLIPGERLMLPPNAAATLDEPRIDTVTAWRRGEVVLEHTRLDEALTEMNRYEDRKLVISSPEIAHLEISGIYHVGDGAGFAATIAMLYHLQVTRTQSEILIAAPARPELRP